MQQLKERQQEEELVLGRYKVTDELGSGGFSTVYKAFDTKMERFVAIKAIPSSSKATSWAKREAQTSARLNHPGIATIYEYNEVDGGHYLIMEYLEGITLRDVLDKREILNPEQAIAIVSDLAIALEYAHINYVIHRDIKPENVMILKDGRLKITDFGTARLLGEVNRESKMLATPAYMSPEQAAGERTDDRTDQFSLAVVLYELLTGTNPFDSDSAKASIFKVANNEVQAPSILKDGISQQLDDACLKALNKNPDRRFETVTDFRYKIERAADGRLPKKEIIKELYEKASGDYDEKAIPDIFRGFKAFLGDTFENKNVIKILPGIILALFVLAYASNITMTAKAAISAALVGLSLASPVISLSVLAAILVIKAFYVSVWLGLASAALSFLYVYLTSRRPLEASFPLTGFLFAKAGAFFCFPVLAGLIFSPFNAALVSGAGTAAVGVAQFASGKQILFFAGSSYTFIGLQAGMAAIVSMAVSWLNGKRGSRRKFLTVICAIFFIVIFYSIIPHGGLAGSQADLRLVMQNASLSLIITMAFILLVPYERLRNGSRPTG